MALLDEAVRLDRIDQTLYWASPCSDVEFRVQAAVRYVRSKAAISSEHALEDFDSSENRRCLQAVYQLLHRCKPSTALCLSGGGIRSATFALGVLQELAADTIYETAGRRKTSQQGSSPTQPLVHKRPLLSQFYYLSTVSGGGYIGAWLAAWINRTRGGCRRVEAYLPTRDFRSVPRQAPAEAAHAIEANGEAAEVTYLRSYTKYLTPRGGLLSHDTWTLLATYVSHLLLNWAVLLPMLAALIIFTRSGYGLFSFRSLAVPPRPWLSGT